MAETLLRAKDAGGDITAWTGDATVSADVHAMVQACVERYGRVDILVNNVGGSRRRPVDLSKPTGMRRWTSI